MKVFTRLISEISEEFKQNPFKLMWMLFWAIPIHTVAFLLTTLVMISSLSWNEGVQFYRRLVR